MNSNFFRTMFIVVLLAGLFSCQNRPNISDVTLMPKPKNVIFFIGDGMGFNQVLAASYYVHGEVGKQPYEQEGWLALASSTYPAIVWMNDTDTVYGTGYSPRQAWADAAYLDTDRTGSAEAATAMSAGVKTYGGSIGLGVDGDTLKHISTLAKEWGKSIGVVSSVQISHATPAGFMAHNKSRNNYGEITNYILFNSMADVVMGAGNPDFDNNGMPVESSERYIGSRELWNQLKTNDGRTTYVVEGVSYTVKDVNDDGNPDPWTLVQEREEFIALATGPAPGRIFGIPKANSTLHYGRGGTDLLLPFEQPLNESVPTLVELTRASLNVLGQNPEGFFVMIEGGAIDWAGHDNLLGRNIEETIDFNNSVQAAIEWVEANSSWDETLIIVTADHETGYLTGPEHPEKVASPVLSLGKGVLPDAKWNTGNHTNMLVPFYAKGKGSGIFRLFADEIDPVRGPFIQNSEIAQALFLMWAKENKE